MFEGFEQRQETLHLIHVWGVRLAHVKGRIDDKRLKAVFPSEARAREWIASQRAPQGYESEPSADYFGVVHRYQLVFKEGSPIQWFNPPGDNYFVSYGWVDRGQLERAVQADHILVDPQ